MAEDYKRVTIETLNKGAVIDLFDEAWQQIMDNIADDNCDAQITREVTVSVKVKPSKDRSSANTICGVKTKLAPIKPTESFVLFSKSGGSMEAYTTDPRQQDLPMEENIVQMQGAK
ncbi:hypothetical protein [Sediminispirochaeta smaragdinae]|uniref:Phage protein n=1 Tax=Sediminispirochaeta smaragdinae (strain DSM 11293 / JCM 15392 / SEBR 4228) TaxID=573413 RepID=E1R3K4_SEDSS|nr:hypothetical protein [Sediminispirochaeta smaragdinae]ADK81635.1 hypothetical protein Spirs_2522 [Sediminispirochaeta smaragdinae DSM 11293]